VLPRDIYEYNYEANTLKTSSRYYNNNNTYLLNQPPFMDNLNLVYQYLYYYDGLVIDGIYKKLTETRTM